MKKEHEEIAKEAFLYLNSKGKRFVLDKMTSDGIPENQVEELFCEYKNQYDSKKESNNFLTFSTINWSLVALVILFLIIKIAFRTNGNN